MDLIIILIFFASLIAVLSMVFHRAWQIQKGRIVISKDNENYGKYLSLEDVNFTILLKSIWKSVKGILHSTILAIIKTWIIILHTAGKLIKKRFPKFRNFLNGSNGNGTNTDNSKTKSIFLKTIAEYKIKIREIRKEVKGKK